MARPPSLIFGEVSPWLLSWYSCCAVDNLDWLDDEKSWNI